MSLFVGGSGASFVGPIGEDDWGFDRYDIVEVQRDSGGVRLLAFPAKHPGQGAGGEEPVADNKQRGGDILEREGGDRYFRLFGGD